MKKNKQFAIACHILGMLLLACQPLIGSVPFFPCSFSCRKKLQAIATPLISIYWYNSRPAQAFSPVVNDIISSYSIFCIIKLVKSVPRGLTIQSPRSTQWSHTCAYVNFCAFRDFDNTQACVIYLCSCHYDVIPADQRYNSFCFSLPYALVHPCKLVPLIGDQT